MQIFAECFPEQRFKCGGLTVRLVSAVCERAKRAQWAE